MSHKLKVGIIGLGILGRRYVDFFTQHPVTEVVALCDVRRPAVDELAAAHGVAGFTDANAMLRAVPALDLAVVATPDHLHRAPALAAIEAGVPTIIQEKPLATTVDDALAIAEAVERRGARFFVNYGNRGMPLDIATHHVVQHGLLGRPVYAEARLDDNISVPTQLWGDRSQEFTAGTSTAHFLLSHVVDLMHWWFAPARVTEVFAVSQSVVLGYTPDLYDAFLRFDSGLQVRVKAEWIKHMDEIVEFYTCISGSQGTLIYNKRPGFGVQESWRANLSNAVSDDDLWRSQDELAQQGIVLAAAGHVQPLAAALGSSVAFFLEHSGSDQAHDLMLVGPMVDAVLEDSLTPSSWRGRGPLPTHVDGLRQVRVVQAIVESAASGRPVTVAP